MRPDDLLEFVRRRPFQPFVIHMTDGQSYEVTHPERIIVARNRAVVGYGGRNGIPQGTHHVSLIHIVRVEDLADASSNQ